MKRFAVIILCYLHVSLLYTQESSRFPINPTAVWKMQYLGLHEEIYEYYIESDTIMNSHTYYKVFKSGVAYYDTPFYYERIYVGALRDEDNKFFYIKKDEQNEVQLFDFNLELGNTIQSLIGEGLIINHIDTLPDGRKRFGHEGICVFYCPVLQIVEGIGHAGGIMEDPPNAHAGFAGHNLRCYFENGELVYHNSFGFADTRCGQNTSLPCGCDINQKTKLFPVPVKDIVTTEFMDPPTGIVSVEIYDTQGIKLLSDRIYNQGDINRFSFDVSTLKKGIYLIKIFDEVTSYTHRFIVER